MRGVEAVESATPADGGAPVERSERRALRFASAGLSHPGYQRSNNEDFAFAGAALIAVADGVGGNVSGEVASESVIVSIAHLEHTFTADPDFEAYHAVDHANRRVLQAVLDAPELAGMATTLSALRLDGEQLVVLHVGDSRAYGLVDGAWAQLTRDDSLVQGLVDAGEITADQALDHPARSVVLQAISGGSFEPHIDIRPATVGDRYLVCSDGLSDYVPDLLISDIMRGDGDPQARCAALVAAALAAGAPDNVTVVVGDVQRIDG